MFDFRIVQRVSEWTKFEMCCLLSIPEIPCTGRGARKSNVPAAHLYHDRLALTIVLSMSTSSLFCYGRQSHHWKTVSSDGLCTFTVARWSNMCRVKIELEDCLAILSKAIHSPWTKEQIRDANNHSSASSWSFTSFISIVNVSWSNNSQ